MKIGMFKSRIEELFDEVSLNGELYAIMSGFIE